jgi:Ca2+/Na+ antiporter
MKPNWDKIKFIALKAFLVLVFLLMPGIRGYKNLQVWEYVLFVALPIVWIIFFWKKDSDKQSEHEIAP